MKTKDIIKSNNAICSKIGRHGIYTDYVIITSLGKHIRLETTTKRGDDTKFAINSSDNLTIPCGISHHKDSGYITIDNKTVYISKEDVINILKVN